MWGCSGPESATAGAVWRRIWPSRAPPCFQHRWAAVARRYKSTPRIAAYELLSEPRAPEEKQARNAVVSTLCTSLPPALSHPHFIPHTTLIAPAYADAMPWVVHTQQEAVWRFYAEACAAVRANDPRTPCLVGAPRFYNRANLRTPLPPPGALSVPVAAASGAPSSSPSSPSSSLSSSSRQLDAEASAALLHDGVLYAFNLFSPLPFVHLREGSTAFPGDAPCCEVHSPSLHPTNTMSNVKQTRLRRRKDNKTPNAVGEEVRECEKTSARKQRKNRVWRATHTVRAARALEAERVSPSPQSTVK